MFTLIENDIDHYYFHPSFGRVPSVNEILSATESQADQDRLRKWQHKMDKVHGVNYANQVRNEALQRGTELHELIEKYWERPSIFSNAENKFFRSVRPFLEVFSNPSDRIYVEQIFGSEDYAGRVDFVGNYRGKPTVIDFTTSLRPKRRQWIERKFLQCAAYSYLILQEGLPCNDLAVVVVNPDTYQLFLGEFSEYLEKWLDRLSQYKRIMGLN